jgi:hypothetical protein
MSQGTTSAVPQFEQQELSATGREQREREKERATAFALPDD